MQRSLKNKTNCCVPQCTSSGTKDPPQSFHKFPSDISHSEIIRKQKWIWKLRIGKTVTKRMRVCSKHFKPTDFFFTGVPCKRFCLKKNAIPSQCLPLTSAETVRKRGGNVHLAQIRAQRCGNSYKKESKIVQKSSKDAGNIVEGNYVKDHAMTAFKHGMIFDTSNQSSHLKNIEIPSWGDSKDFEKKLSTVSIKPKRPSESCCIENCKNYHNTGANIIFHKFPLKDEDLTRKWVENICQKNFVPTVHHVICSKHFTVECYLNGYVCAHQLKNDAIPTVFDFPVKRQKQLKEHNNFSTAMIDTTGDTTCNLDEMNELPIFKDETDSESNTDIEELFSLENGSEDSQEVLKQKLKKLTDCYKKSQTKMKEYQQQCKLYVKEITELKEIINNLKEIISVTDGNYFKVDS